MLKFSLLMLLSGVVYAADCPILTSYTPPNCVPLQLLSTGDSKVDGKVVRTMQQYSNGKEIFTVTTTATGIFVCDQYGNCKKQ